MPESQNDPWIPFPVQAGVEAGKVYANAGSAIGALGAVPAWMQKAGAYLTDKGTLIRIGVFVMGAVMILVGVLLLAKEPVGKAVTTVAKVVK